MISYKCPKCRTQLKSPRSMAGMAELCPECGMPVTVPMRRPVHRFRATVTESLLGLLGCAQGAVAALVLVGCVTAGINTKTEPLFWPIGLGIALALWLGAAGMLFMNQALKYMRWTAAATELLAAREP